MEQGPLAVEVGGGAGARCPGGVPAPHESRAEWPGRPVTAHPPLVHSLPQFPAARSLGRVPLPCPQPPSLGRRPGRPSRQVPRTRLDSALQIVANKDGNSSNSLTRLPGTATSRPFRGTVRLRRKSLVPAPPPGRVRAEKPEITEAGWPRPLGPGPRLPQTQCELRQEVGSGSVGRPAGSARALGVHQQPPVDEELAPTW